MLARRAYCSNSVLPWLLAALLSGFAPSLHAACTASNPNASLMEATPTADFTVHGDGTVTHAKTNLTWDRCAWGQAGDAMCTGDASAHTWGQALAVVVTANNANHKGHNDWRLPNIKELQSIVESCGYMPAINTTIFPNTPVFFWSASSYAPDPTNAWYIYYDGLVYLDAKTSGYAVRLVRGGQSLDTFDLLSVGRLTASKQITGAAAGSVPAGTAFPITLTCGATVLGPINATTAAPAVFNGVPSGSCTVSEGASPAITGVIWGAASYTPASAVTVSVGANTDVTVTNTADITTYAITIAANPTSSGTVSCTPNPVNHSGTATCAAAPAAGYTFGGWSGDCTGAGACVLTNVTAVQSVMANFTLNSYVIAAAASPAAGGTISCTPNPVEHGGTATCTAAPAAGYAFGGFSGDCAGTMCALSEITSPRNVTALFTLNNYAVIVAINPAGGGTVSCTPNPVEHGGTATCTAAPAAGYTFGGFGGDCAGATCTLANVTSTKSVTAGFTLNSYAITATASPAAGGTVSCTPNPVEYGGTATCTATPAAGYTFGGFGGDCAGATCTLNNITADRNVTATFTLNNSYAIAAVASPAAGGTVSCIPNPVNHGGTSTCTATPAAGYTFVGWSGDCSGTSCTLSDVTGPRSVTATFAGGANKDIIVPTATGTGEVSVSVAGGGEECGFGAARFVPVGNVAAPPPAATTFPHGLFEFTLTHCAVGGTVTLTQRYPAALPTEAAYWKYGPILNQAGPHWYRWPQATIAGDTVTFTITDGGLGDADLATNGTIVDPGGPAVAVIVEIPTLSEWAMLILLGLLLGMAGWTLRRQAAS